MNNPINYIRTAAGSLAKSAQVSGRSVSMAVVKDTGSALAARARASWGHAAIGAGIGGGAGYLNSTSNDPRQQITSTLKGAGIGAGVGLGIGVARKSWGSMKNVGRTAGSATKSALTDAHAAGMASIPPTYVKPGPGPWKASSMGAPRTQKYPSSRILPGIGAPTPSWNAASMGNHGSLMDPSARRGLLRGSL